MDKEEIETRFTYHPPRGLHQQTLYETIRGHGKAFALVIEAMVPESREKSLAVTKLEEVVMWANAAVARRD